MHLLITSCRQALYAKVRRGILFLGSIMAILLGSCGAPHHPTTTNEIDNTPKTTITEALAKAYEALTDNLGEPKLTATDKQIGNFSGKIKDITKKIQGLDAHKAEATLPLATALVNKLQQ